MEGEKMTCVVGWIEKKQKVTAVTMGADGQTTSGYSKHNGYDKLFENGDFLMGGTGAVHATELLKHVWKPPDRKVGQTDAEYLHKEVVPSIRKLFKDNGHATVNNNRENITEKIMIAYNAAIYVMHQDYCLMKSIRPFESIGCGDEYALGACHILYKDKGGVEEKIRRAILAADEFSTGVDDKITVRRKEWKNK